MKNKKEEKCQGRYYVSGYETDDGKKVSGYYRTCWKHGTQGNSGSMQASDTEDGGIYPKRMPEKGNEGLPAPEQNPQGNDTGNNNHPVLDTIWTILGTAPEIFAKYMEYKTEADKRQIYYAPVRQNYLVAADNSSYLDVQPSPSKFDPKKTSENIKEAMDELNEINKKEIITKEDLDLSKGYLTGTVSKVCEDCENYLEEKEIKIENLTIESVEKSKNLSKVKSNILENIEQSMFMVNKVEKIQDKEWEKVNTSDEGYGNKLQEYAKSKETITNIKKNLRYLYQSIHNSWDIANNFINLIKDAIHTKNVINKMIFLENPINYFDKQKREDTFLKYTDKQVANAGGFGFATLYNMPNAYNLMKIGLRDNNYNANYVKQNGKLYNSINDIDSSKYNIQGIKNRVSEETNGRMKDCKVLVLRPDSSMAEKIKMSYTFYTFLNENRYNLIKNGSIPDTTIEFDGPDSDLYNCFHGALINDIKYENREVSLKIEDFYNFNKDRPSLRGRIGEKLQNQGDLENYYIIVEIKFKMP